MTKQVRDWQFDTKLCSKVKEDGHTEVTADIVTDIATHWLQQYAHEANQVCYWKGEAKAAEAREKKLREAMEAAVNEYCIWKDKERAAKVMATHLEDVLISLYPEEGEAK